MCHIKRNQMLVAHFLLLKLKVCIFLSASSEFRPSNCLCDMIHILKPCILVNFLDLPPSFQHSAHYVYLQWWENHFVGGRSQRSSLCLESSLEGYTSHFKSTHAHHRLASHSVECSWLRHVPAEATGRSWPMGSPGWQPAKQEERGPSQYRSNWVGISHSGWQF